MFNYLKNKGHILNNISKNIPVFEKTQFSNFMNIAEKSSKKTYFNFLNVKNFSFYFKKNINSNSNKLKPNNDRNKFVRLYPKDKVAVLPAFGVVSKLSHFERRILKKYNVKDTRIKLATINKIQRKKGLAYISNNKTKNKYIDLNILGYHFENGNLSMIKHHKESVPVELNRLTLYNKVEKDRNKKIISIKPAKLIKGRDNSFRVDAVTKKVFPVKLPTFEEVEKLRQKKHETKKPSALDTDYNTAIKSTYNGEDFEDVTKNFLKRIFLKVSTERKLILKDQ